MDKQPNSHNCLVCGVRLVSMFLLFLTPAICLSEESFVGQWLSERRTPAGIGKTLELSSDGRIRLSQGLVIGYERPSRPTWVRTE